MNKDEFNRLTIEEQIGEFNKLYKIERSIRKVCDSIGIAKSTLGDRFRKHNYVLKDVGYMQNSNGQKSENAIVNKSTKCEQKQQPTIDQPKTVNLLELKKQVTELLDWKLEVEKQLRNNKFTNEIKISEKCTGEYKGRSFEVYNTILNNFIEFGKSQPYTMRDLISQAILEFIETHKM